MKQDVRAGTRKGQMGDGRPPSAREMGVKGHRNYNRWEMGDRLRLGRWESRATETATVKGQMGDGRPPSAREMGVKGHRNCNSKRIDGRWETAFG
jgi:hypothetical protein